MELARERDQPRVRGLLCRVRVEGFRLRVNIWRGKGESARSVWAGQKKKKQRRTSSNSNSNSNNNNDLNNNAGLGIEPQTSTLTDHNHPPPARARRRHVICRRGNGVIGSLQWTRLVWLAMTKGTDSHARSEPEPEATDAN